MYGRDEMIPEHLQSDFESSVEQAERQQTRFHVERRLYPEVYPGGPTPTLRWCVMEGQEVHTAPFDDKSDAEEMCDHLNFGKPMADEFTDTDFDLDSLDLDPTGEVGFYERKKEAGFMG